MKDKEKLILDKSDETASTVVPKWKENYKLPWYFASGFLLFWGLLFYAVVIPYFYKLPTALTMEDAKKNVFIAERAYNNLYTLSNIGNKLAGSKENEIDAVNFLTNELNDIKSNMLSDYFDLEVDVSRVSGEYPYKNLLNVYQGVQNIAAKLSPKNSTSQTYLLVNSHFDSKPATSSAGDAGFMIVTMLEVLRVMTTTKQTFDHPIVFLFNGAEERMMQASHGFITQHKWAPFCKAVVNLDAGGSGGREVLLQSGPNHSWLLNYYKNYIKYPFGTSLGGNNLQADILPSDSDFRQFNIYGKIPGFNIIQLTNGYIYHTKYDVIDVIPRESLQNTGDNILSLVRGLSNATELRDTKAHKNGQAIYFDFLGLYLIHYSKTAGSYLNFAVAGAALVLVYISIWRMAEMSEVSSCYVVFWFTLMSVIQVIALVLGIALPAVVAYTFDIYGLPLTHYSTPWLIIGLYVCPSLIGLSWPLTISNFFQRNDKISSAYHSQLALHAQAVILALLVIGITFMGYGIAFIFMIPLLFYVVSLAFNLLTTLHDRGYAWSGLVKISQIIPFLYISYLFYFLVVVCIPMGARAGSATNWDLYIAVITAVGTVLSFGFLIPFITSFRRPGFVVLSLVVVSALTMYLASRTQLGFPYRPKTNGQRVAYLAVRNRYYEYDGRLSKDESGYLFNYLDRREEKPLLGTRVNLTGLVNLKPNCDKYMMCGMPLFDYRYVANRLQSKWLPRTEAITPPGVTTLKLQYKTVINATTVRFGFELSGPSFMSLFIAPYEDVKISNWSFLRSYLDNPPPPPLSYHIYFTYGIDKSPLKFFLEFSKSNGAFNVPLCQMGVSGHFIGNPGDAQMVKFAASFPPFAIQAAWPSLYQRYIF